jgi:dienelactone hydrolase
VQGLWPLPERTPLNAHIFGRVEYPDYAIEKIYFESHPGFLCTGNLYTPRGVASPYPAILSPHGHWAHGRLEQGADGGVRARCVTLARMGLAVFAYDMVGYNDSVQVPAHKFLTRRGALWGYTPLALQTWNSLRAVDFLLSLPEVDPERLGCTGASGGASQLLLLAAAEERVRVLAPVNMISAHFQGGCACENAPGLRTDTFNVEIAALAAPRPMLMVSATGDWTANTPRIEYPAVRGVYALYGAEDRLAWVQEDAPHNYNRASRAHVYRWFARWLLGDEALGRDVEGELLIEPAERLRVFPGGTLPAGMPRGAALESHLAGLARSRFDAMRPDDAGALDRLAAVSRERLRHTLDLHVPAPGAIIAEPAGEPEAGPSWQAQDWWLGRPGAGDLVPATVYRTTAGREANAPARWAVAVSGSGGEGLCDAAGEPGALIRGLLDRGYVVLAPSPLWCGPVPADALPRHDDDPTWLCFNTSCSAPAYKMWPPPWPTPGPRWRAAVGGLGQWRPVGIVGRRCIRSARRHSRRPARRC